LLEPLPETTSAIDDYLEWSQPGLGQLLGRLAQEVGQIVPEMVALSLTLVEDDLTFTLATRSVTTAVVDAMQYLDGGPCEESLRIDDLVAVTVDDLLDENRWSLFAQAAAAVGIRSSLSLPVREAGLIVGGVNLYASTRQAFDANHDAVARVIGARAEEAVRHADLSFSSRERALETPGRVRDLNIVDTAVGLLMARYGETEDLARDRLTRAAAQGGVRPAVMASALLELHRSPGASGDLPT
jgi:GAF domain-containing protein